MRPPRTAGVRHPLRAGDVGTGHARVVARRGQQLWRQVQAGDPRSQSGGGDGDDPGAARDVEHAKPRADAGMPDQAGG